jgi:hypothetical protein
MGAIRFPVLAILLLVACPFAAGPANACPAPTAGQAWTISSDLACSLTSMGIVVGLGTAIGAAIAVLSYYVSTVMNDEKNKAGAINEIRATIINVFIFAFVIGAIVSIDKFFQVLALDPNGDMVNATTSMYKGNIDYLMPEARQMVGVYSDALQLQGSSSSISGYIDLPWGIKITTNFGRTATLPILERLGDALDQATITIVSICGQQAMMANLMRYFVLASCQLLLPFGFFLRAIPYVRRAGSTLVAIGIALVLIYPASLFFMGSIMFGIQQAAVNTMFGNGFNPEQSALAGTLSTDAAMLRSFAISYTVVGDILEFSNTAVKGAGADVAAVLVAVFGIGQAMGGILKVVFLIANMIISYVATTVIFAGHQIFVATIDNYFLSGGGMDAAINLEYDAAIFGTIINMTHVLLMASVALTVVGGIRALAVLLGGEFFLYGLTEYI